MLRTVLATVAIALNVAHLFAQDSPQYGILGDSVVVAAPKSGSPVGALWRSAVLPGWGQAYNRQWYKIPFIYGAIGGLTAAAAYNKRWFDRYNKAYLYAAFLSEQPHPYPEYADDYAPYQVVSASSLKARRDRALRNRDLSIIGIGIAYAFTLLDAYVNGHLRGFDVSGNLAATSPLGGPEIRVTVKMAL